MQCVCQLMQCTLAMGQDKVRVEVALLATASPSNHIFDRPTFSYSVITTLALCDAKAVVAIVGQTLTNDLYLNASVLTLVKLTQSRFSSIISFTL